MNVSVPTNWSRGSTVIVYVPVTASVNALRVAVGPEANNVATLLPLGLRTMRSTPGIVLPETDKLTLCPAVALNVRTATSPIVPIVTVVGVPIAVVPVLSGTALIV